MIKFLITTFLFSTFSIVCGAQQPVITAYTFQAWKEQQVLEAQNQLLRTSARIAQLKNSKPGAPGSKDALNIGSRLKKVEQDPVLAGEKDLRRAQESLQAASNLTMDEYVAIYLPTLADSPDAIQSLTQRLNKEELAEILKGLLKRDAPSDAKRNSSLVVDALSLTSRSKTP